MTQPRDLGMLPVHILTLEELRQETERLEKLLRERNAMLPDVTRLIDVRAALRRWRDKHN